MRPGELIWRHLGQNGFAIEKHNAGTEWFLRLEVGNLGELERLDVRDVLKWDVSAADRDDVVHGNLHSQGGW